MAALRGCSHVSGPGGIRRFRFRRAGQTKAGHAVDLEVDMAAGTIIVIVIVIVIVAAAAAVAVTVLRRRALRQRFGPEYNQLASKVGPRRAQAELSERERRVAKLDLRPLSPERRAGYDREWMSLQETFIDSPAQAVESAAGVVSAVAADCGYPTGDDEELLADLSVYHADRLDEYRRAREITGQAGTAGTEELREALLGYRALFRDLVGEPEPEAEPGAAGPAAAGTAGPAAAGTAGTTATAGSGSADGATGAESPSDEADETDAGETDEVGDAGEAEAVTAERGARDGETWADSGRNGRGPVPIARKE
jgi:hypothetical protein